MTTPDSNHGLPPHDQPAPEPCADCGQTPRVRPCQQYGSRYLCESCREGETAPYVDAFFDAYVECALWSSVEYGADGEYHGAMDQNYGPVLDIDPESLAEMRAECEAFVLAEWDDLQAADASAGQHGHDFWLTRNRHGAGFWDRGYGAVGDRLTAAAHAYGSSDLYVGDDGAVYVS